MKAFYAAEFGADIGNHIMPMSKFKAVAKAVAARSDVVKICPPTPVNDEQLLWVHSAAYVEAVRTGRPRELAESQKFPWSSKLATSVRWTNGAVIEAAFAALDDGIACAICSGFHHAHADHGEGFCTFNGLVLALEATRRAGRLQRGLVVDLDLHYGNGTVALLATRPWAYNLSIYGSWYEANAASTDVDSCRAADTANCWSRAVPNGAGADTYLAIIRESLSRMLVHARPDLILYQAGADPFREDPYSPLNLDASALFERDRLVFAAANKAGIPIAWVLAGGYTPDTDKVVQIHVNTFLAAEDIFAASRSAGASR